MQVYERFSEDIKILDFDICIVGAGIAGIYTLLQLAEFKKLKILIIESGDQSIISHEQDSFIHELDLKNYQGGSHGRAFGVGGTSAFWGGVLIPFSNIDKVPRYRQEWEFIVETCNRYSSVVLKNLGIKKKVNFFSMQDYLGKTIEENLLEKSYIPSYSLHLPFRKKNFKSILKRKSIFHNKNITMIKNATVTDWETAIAKGSTIKKITAIFPDKKSISISAKEYVIAAGAIESTRILLEMDQKYGNALFSKSQMLGQMLSDHISVTYAKARFKAKKDLIKHLPLFKNRNLRTLRINDLRTNDQFRHFFHFIFTSKKNDEIESLKEFLRHFQARSIKDFNFKNFFRAISGIIKISYFYLLFRRLYFDYKNEVIIQFDFSKPPDKESYIYLNNNSRDKYLRPIPTIRWDIAKDLKNIDRIKKGILERFPREILNLEIINEENLKENNFYDAYHPCGTLRLGPRDRGIVGNNLRVHHFKNLYVISTAIFPEAASANPTFSMLCMSHELVRNLIKRFY